jgi:spermidine synthase
MSKPWQIIDSVKTSDGILELRQRGERDFLITIAGRILMNSSANKSEIVLSELACNSLINKNNYRVLIGGLGMGYTLKSALDNLPGDTRVVVAELNPIVVKWCREPLAHLTEKAVEDPRVVVKIADVSSLIRKAAKQGGDSRFDAIVLDLYEGPSEAAKERSEHLYGVTALKLSGSALMPGGVLAIWSEDSDRAFEKRLLRAGFSFERKRPGRGGRHVVYIARMRKPIKR